MSSVSKRARFTNDRLNRKEQACVFQAEISTRFGFLRDQTIEATICWKANNSSFPRSICSQPSASHHGHLQIATNLLSVLRVLRPMPTRRASFHHLRDLVGSRCSIRIADSRPRASSTQMAPSHERNTRCKSKTNSKPYASPSRLSRVCDGPSL